MARQILERTGGEGVIDNEEKSRKLHYSSEVISFFIVFNEAVKTVFYKFVLYSI